MSNSNDERRDGGDRRVADRRKAAGQDYAGPERRQGNRRSSEDRRETGE